jgi:hypothetical protein
MMRIGTIDANDQLIEAEMDGRVFVLGLSWNQEGALWTLSLRDIDRVVLASGLAVVPNWGLLRQARRPEFPPGELAVDAPAGHTLTRRSFIDDIAALFYILREELI